jgi:putative ABC transport system permease protein
MIPGVQKLVFQSIRFYHRQVLYQILIIALLSAVIAGSLLTGRSVKASLKRSASERLGNTGIMISSGIRYFDADLATRIRDSIKIGCTGILEINGYSQNLKSQKGAFDTHIYAVNKDFFKFQGSDSVRIDPGEVAINRRLADYLEVKAGDDIVIKFRDISDIPANSPFAPARENGKSVVMRIGTILRPSDCADFSLSISQIMPMNIFMNLDDIQSDEGKRLRINRLIVDRAGSYSLTDLNRILKNILLPADIGLSFRRIPATGETELISDRVFIDEGIIRIIQNSISSSAPVITYLGNSFKSGSGSTPYSFISALPSSIYPEIVSGDNIIISRWMAEDLNIAEGSPLEVFFYSPDSLNHLIEHSHKFIVNKITDRSGIWSDSLLMPDFPGISASKSCSEWDAGVPIKLNEIRSKDEDYWQRYRGTPKAFINYEKGKELWGNNFGPSTAIRFPSSLSIDEVKSGLRGVLDPGQTGFSITDISKDADKAATEGIDFGTLFLSLGFFLIIASLVLLSFAVSSYLDSKRGHLNTLFALGFKNGWIVRLIFTEVAYIGLIGCLAGAFTGYFVNIIITAALNSVWTGAVQTNTLSAIFSISPILTGFSITILTVLVIMLIKTKRFIRSFYQKKSGIRKIASHRENRLILLISFVITISLYIFSVLSKEHIIALYFVSGAFLLITFILFWRQFFTGQIKLSSGEINSRMGLSHRYYSFNPSKAVTPVLFIAAGIFAVFITGANRMDNNDKRIKRSDGTGGYQLWCESSIPIKEDLNLKRGRKVFGLDSDSLSALSFVQIVRSSGNDASCLNLNHITSPPLLGVDPVDFINKNAFSFSRTLGKADIKNPWQYLDIPVQRNTIYGIADQTVLDWGLKLKPGDTLILRAENGQPLNIIIAAGLKSSVFQGYVLIGKENFTKNYPSVSGSSVLLTDGDPLQIGSYKSILNDRFENYGMNIENTTVRLASFNKVTNTYLSVFGIFGAFGMITGVAGLGFVLLRNYNQRKKEFALMMAVGFSFNRIKGIILSEQILILFAGVSSGVLSAIVATLPSIKGSHDIPWLFLIFMILSILLTGLTVLFISVRSITADSLSVSLKKD